MTAPKVQKHKPYKRAGAAIKVSSAQFSKRFEREAQTIASLNHNNICHLYKVGPNYLVMELIDGELSLDVTLDYARRIEKLLRLHTSAGSLIAT